MLCAPNCKLYTRSKGLTGMVSFPRQVGHIGNNAEDSSQLRRCKKNENAFIVPLKTDADFLSHSGVCSSVAKCDRLIDFRNMQLKRAYLKIIKLVYTTVYSWPWWPMITLKAVGSTTQIVLCWHQSKLHPDSERIRKILSWLPCEWVYFGTFTLLSLSLQLKLLRSTSAHLIEGVVDGATGVKRMLSEFFPHCL